jgi:recombination protein RecA
VDVIIVDSVAALTPKAEIEGEMGDSHVGLQARLMSQALRKLTGNVKHANCLMVFINQIRMKIGVMFGSPKYLLEKVYECVNEPNHGLQQAA